MSGLSLLFTRTLKRGYLTKPLWTCQASRFASTWTPPTCKAGVEANTGISYVTIPGNGATASVALVARAGTRYQPGCCVAEALSMYAFRSTENRSTLRIVREFELLGGEIVTRFGREHIIIGAKFFPTDVHYFVDLLAEVVASSKFSPHQLKEEIKPLISHAQKEYALDTHAIALNAVHTMAFHRGLGAPLRNLSHEACTSKVNVESVANYAKEVYGKGNFTLVGRGIDHHTFGQSIRNAFTGKTLSSTSVARTATMYYGGEYRAQNFTGNSVVMGFPGTSIAFDKKHFKPEVWVLTAILGGGSRAKWTNGQSLLAQVSADRGGINVQASHFVYTDAGLMCISLKGEDGKAVREAAVESIKLLKGLSCSTTTISSDVLRRGIAQAKFNLLEQTENFTEQVNLAGIGMLECNNEPLFEVIERVKALEKVTSEQVIAAAKLMVKGKGSFAAVGDLDILPFAEEVGLDC